MFDDFLLLCVHVGIVLPSQEGRSEGELCLTNMATTTHDTMCADPGSSQYKSGLALG